MGFLRWVKRRVRSRVFDIFMKFWLWMDEETYHRKVMRGE